MQKFLITLHRWCGFPLGILFLVTFATGALTSVDELLKRAQLTAFNQRYNYEPRSQTQQAEGIEKLLNTHAEARQVTLPTPNTPYFKLVGREESWTYAIDDLTINHHEQHQEGGIFNTILQLHRNYLLGREGMFGVEGKHYAAWVALLSLAISVLGLWIWWPLRRSFKTRNLVPNGVKRKHFYHNHMTSGVVVLVAIVLLSLTGAAITYRGVAQKLLGVSTETDAMANPIHMESNWSAWLAESYKQMPNGSTLTQVQMPRQRGPATEADRGKGSARGERRGGAQNTERRAEPERPVRNEPQLITLRFTTPGDWLGLAGSQVKIDPSKSTLVESRPFGQLGFGEKLFNLLKPLHTGHNLPAVYVVVQLLFSILGTIMVFTGLISFVVKKRKWLKLPRLRTSSATA